MAPSNKLSIFGTLKLYAWEFQYTLREVVAAILHELSEWIAP